MACGSSGFHPRAAWPSRKVHQCQRCESGRVADRPLTLRAEALDRRGRGTRLASPPPVEVIHPDRRTPEPLFASAASPEFSLGLSLGAWSGHRGLRPFPLATANQDRGGTEARKRRSLFGLHRGLCSLCGITGDCSRLLTQLFHPMWSCAKRFSLTRPQNQLCLGDSFVVHKRCSRRSRDKQHASAACGKPSSQQQV
jgi:hypothetical protein